jgi:hypothetical protein
VKLLLDTCVWGGAAEQLRLSGHDVVWSGDWDEDPGDEEILYLARTEGRILVTLDKDFGELTVVRGLQHCGLPLGGRKERAMVWEKWVPRWRRAIAACERIGSDGVRLHVGPAAAALRVEAVEREMHRPIPRSLRSVLLGFSGDVDFFWFLPNGVTPPEPFDGVFYGGCCWDVGELSRINQRLDWLVEHCFVADEPDHRLWRDKFAFQSILNGDFLAIDITETTPQPIVYLNRELGESHGYQLAPDFIDFIDVWTRLGCPTDDVFPLFIPARDGFLDSRSERAKQWCTWFGLPDPETA